MRIVVALGGNALLRRGERPDAAPQRRHVAAAAAALADIAREHQVVVVHGNGPQVGLLALESGSDPSLSKPYPLADLVAESQGLIGLWLQQALLAEMAGEVVTLVSQTVVDPEDGAFQVPTKFIGQVYDELSARRFAAWHGWTIQADRDGWRRVVASPLPIDIVELPIASRLLDMGVTVVLAGGGGVPVVDRDGRYESVDAVVDKDRAAALAAERLGADLLLVITDVEGVIRDFGDPAESPEALGFNAPQSKVTLTSKAGETVVVELGREKPGTSDTYLRVVGNPVVYRVSKYSAERLIPEAKTFQEDEKKAGEPEAPQNPMAGMGGDGQIPPEVMRQLQQQMQMQGGGGGGHP